MDSTASREVAKRYNIQAIPTFVFVDEEGNEIDRIVGFREADEYLAEMKRIREGVDTYPDLVRQWDANPQDANVLQKLAAKVEAMAGLSAAVGYWEELFELEDVSTEVHAQANLKLAVYHSETNGDPNTLISLLKLEKDVDILAQAHRALRTFYRTTGDSAAEAEAYRVYVNFMVGIDQEEPGLLNGYAWRMTQLERNLDDALMRINRAVELLPADAGNREQAQILDTKAEVLWKLGRSDEALEVIATCIELQPEDEYYQEQRSKFQAAES